ncbi:aspartate aminotransferase family protein [Kushneria konosiri]|uniref:4-aminobutyrate aminotransferase n=1 Tax=Kushneria konosiri TaxID=698828 RepID=A0A2Z2H7W6_9GAMM|nr:aspartate aminotransferase family protein [Kushneria konosiri]ARS53553.1 4-aminobutyrate aminotransferase [Kushneria konosiri]
MEFPHVSSALGIVHPLRIEQGVNAEVWDSQGHRYIDFVAGIGVHNLGHGHPAIRTALHHQVDRLIHAAFNATPHGGYLDLVAALDTFVPVSYPLTTMLTNSGAEATENALKIARAHTGREAVIAFDDGFHGRTLAALNLNGKVKPYKQSMGSLPGPVYHLPFPSPDNDVTDAEASAALVRLCEVSLPVDEIACVIVEPVQGEGGFRRLSPGFARHLRDFCNHHGIVLIFDEIQCGFGRTGERFAFSHLEVEPDLLLMGKSMAAGVPLAAVAGRAELMNAVPKGGLGGTYSGNALACAAALKVIELMSEDNLARWSQTVALAILAHYHTWQDSQRYPMIGAITGIGAMRGIVFEDTCNASGSEHLAALVSTAREHGLLLMPSGRKRNILRLFPPLTIEPEILEEGLSRLGRALDTLTP